MDKTNTVLWKIGSSVVMTVSSSTVKRLNVGLNGGLLTVLLKVKGDSINFPARPWKCGGSYVVTVPSTYVELYGLKSLVESKAQLYSSIKLAHVNNNV